MPALRGGLDILEHEDLRPALAEVMQPVLVVHGAEDQLVPLAAARHLALALPRARLEVIDGTAHAPFVSDPYAVAELVSEHFDER
jgi:pimeloyl-[acyl-carrier protein] methyl ester esterase